MIFKRKIYDEILSWKKNSRGRTALLIEGARRVGKSTITEEFGRNEYRSYLLIDFSMANARLKNIFNNHLTDIDEFFLLLQAQTNTRLYRRDSLVIFDEIQKFPRAREAIKALVADGRYDFIETGSLISIRENVENILIPSEEHSIRMYPMDFEEFAQACGEKPLLDYIKECFEKKTEAEPGLHRKAMLLLKQYMIVGGMPQSVSPTRSFFHCSSRPLKIHSTETRGFPLKRLNAIIPAVTSASPREMLLASAAAWHSRRVCFVGTAYVRLLFPRES